MIKVATKRKPNLKAIPLLSVAIFLAITILVIILVTNRHADKVIDLEFTSNKSRTSTPELLISKNEATFDNNYEYYTTSQDIYNSTNFDGYNTTSYDGYNVTSGYTNDTTSSYTNDTTSSALHYTTSGFEDYTTTCNLDNFLLKVQEIQNSSPVPKSNVIGFI